MVIFFLGTSVIHAEDNSTIAEDSLLSDDSALEEVNIEVNDMAMYYRSGERLNVGLYDSANEAIVGESLIIDINGINYTKTTNNEGRTSLAINLNPGVYLANVYFLGNDKYSGANATATVDVLPTIEGSDLVKYYKNSTAYTAYFADGLGDPLDNENVQFNINGVFYTRKTDVNGFARLNINLVPGDYIISSYSPVNDFVCSNNIKVLSTINACDVHKIFRDSNQYTPTFYGFNGEVLMNTIVKFNVNGIFYTRKTNEDGIAKMNINLPQGEYIITSYNPINDQTYSNKINVDSYSTTQLTSKSQSFKANEDDTIKANLTNNLNYGVFNEEVTLSVNGKTFTALTDENGVASFNPNLPQGNYSLTFSYPGSSTYGSSNTASSIEVFDGIKAIVNGADATLYKGELYGVTLFDEYYRPMANEIVYFKIGDDIYNDTTDDNGIATLVVDTRSGYHTVEAFFNKTDYKFSKSISQILVVKSNKTVITPIINDVTEGLGNTINVKLSADNVNLKNKKVILEINKRNYTRTTNDNGLANITINLAGGTYDIKFYFLGDDFFEPAFNSSSLYVKPRISTHLTSLSESRFYKNSGMLYRMQLLSTSPLSGKEVTFTVGSKVVNTRTDGNGIAYLNIDDLNIGSYTVTCRFNGDKDYSPCELSQPLEITFEIPYGYSYWVRYDDMYNLNLASLASLGTRHLFLHSYSFTAYGESTVLSWIRSVNSYGIQVHIWMQVFYSGSWVIPVNDADGSFKYSFMQSKINEAAYYASLSGVGGVHFDYLRCPGNAYKHPNSVDAINYFVSQAASRVKSINPNCILSAAVMPEPNMMIYYYAQDIPTISKYLDVLIPMIYKGNYGKNTDWIRQTTQQFVSMSNGAQVWTGLQTYRSDSDITKLSYDELFADAQAALDGGARGVDMFRWGVTNFINFNDLRK